MEPRLFSSTKQRLSTKRFRLKLAIDETSFKFVNKELHMMGGNTPRNGGTWMSQEVSKWLVSGL